MNFIGGNGKYNSQVYLIFNLVLSRIESKIGDIFQRNIGSMFGP
jgi:hypothetical protein